MAFGDEQQQAGDEGGRLMCVCGRTDLSSAAGYWQGCPNGDCPGLDVAVVDPADGSWEFSPHLERLVRPHLSEGWSMESGSPGGDFVLWRYEERYSVALSPHVCEDGQVHWLLGVLDDMGGPVVDQVEGPVVTLPGEQVAAWVAAVLPGVEAAAQAALGSR